jgi:hypothetical protein
VDVKVYHQGGNGQPPFPLRTASASCTSRLTDSQIEFPAMSRIEIRAKNVYDEIKLNFSIYNESILKRVSLVEAEITKD